mgnify:CR=1 FL=1
MADEDTAGVAGGAATGALSGASTGAYLGTTVFPGIGTALGAILGGVIGAAGSGLSTHAAQKNQELARQGSGAPVQCPEGFVFDAASGTCVMAGNAGNAGRDLSDLVRSLKDKDGESKVVNMVTQMFKSKDRKQGEKDWLADVDAMAGGTPVDLPSDPL